jgi:hypothetical protein
MGDIDEEDTVSNGTRLSLKGDGLSHDLLPCAEDGIVLDG